MSESNGNGNGNGRKPFRRYPSGTHALGSLAPGTRFKAGTTEGVVLRQHPVMKESVVTYRRYGSTQGARVKSWWCASIRVELVS